MLPHLAEETDGEEEEAKHGRGDHAALRRARHLHDAVMIMIMLMLMMMMLIIFSNNNNKMTTDTINESNQRHKIMLIYYLTTSIS